MRPVRVAIASITELPQEFRDDEVLVDRLGRRGVEADTLSWDDPRGDWDSYDLVVIRSTWDYSRRRDQFIAWAERVGDRLENSPAVVRWNSDKRYLGDLREAGLPVVETRYVEPGEQPPEIVGEVVVKPTISAGGRDTGRFAPGAASAAFDLIARIGAGRRTAMVQPFLDSVDTDGETAVVVIGGLVSHVLRKRAVLRADQVAPVRDDALGAAEAMYDPGLVLAGTAEPDELELAAAVVDEVRRRFGATPLYARVDMLRDGDRSPVVLELEAVEPSLYLTQADGAAERLAEAILGRVRRHD
jgi:glutathione synthase/RimK-type ligase-like ATP-grasp enzyme